MQQSGQDNPLPQSPFYSVEYPGYVTLTSIPIAVKNMGGQGKINNAFRKTSAKTEGLIEVNLSPGSPFSHPIPGNVVATNNILLKVVKRKYKKPEVRMEVGATEPFIGEYKVEMAGVIPKTARFRKMADFQYRPPDDDPITKLRTAMDNMDVQFIKDFIIQPENEDYLSPVEPIHSSDIDPELLPDAPISSAPEMKSNLRLFPPPLFSRQGISQNYSYKQNPASIVATTIDEETGEERKRMVNRMRWKGYGPAPTSFSEPTVPDKPPSNISAAGSDVGHPLLAKLKDHFSKRPIWTRLSLFNQFSHDETREIVNSKILLPLVCYVFQDGPWRDTLIRFGYDPRKSVDARFYQRLYFRNVNHPIARPSVIARRQERVIHSSKEQSDNEPNRKNSHIFDGVTLAKETAAFQLCDITDPMLKGMIEDESELRESCSERDGWYTTTAFEHIKAVLRHKFFCLLEGYQVTDEECQALLTSNQMRPQINRNIKSRAGKHNMAKGALRPEDAAAVRLRAILEKNARNFQH